MEIRKLKLKDPTFPAVLRNIPNPPQQIYVMGELEPLLARPRLAVVGSRQLTAYGLQVTNQLIKPLARQGVVIVSGLALGIDGQAHTAALGVSGGTIAVLGGGHRHLTPKRNLPIARRIIKQSGVIMSEYEPGAKPHRHTFIARNRLIAGMADGLLIPEAAILSGTRHTVQAALEQGKVVMAVPGRIDAPLSAGPHQLISTGATLVSNSEDILFALGLKSTETERQQTELFGASEEETALLRLLQTGITDGANLLAKSGMGVSLFNQTLTMLEISDRIYATGGDQWALKY